MYQRSPLSMSPWTQVSGKPFFERPLGALEQVFYWDSAFEGTADLVECLEVELDEHFHQTVYDIQSNIVKAWISLKREFPLLGARLQERSGTDVVFLVDEFKLRTVTTDEVKYHPVASQDEAQAMAYTLVTGPRQLSNDLLARVYVLPRTDLPARFHVFIHVTHLITDGMANISMNKKFLERMAIPNTVSWSLKDRLALAIPLEDAHPARHLNAARRRWRKAIGYTIAQIRSSKQSGGHTLPRRLSRLTTYTPARSGHVAHELSEEETSTIMHFCRKYKLTFGNVFPLLGHLALTRVLCRRYLRGDMSEEEWGFRKKEPLTTAGPLNLRPLLDTEWYKAGGSNHVVISIGFFFYTLPFMPLGRAQNLRRGDAVPSYTQLLSSERFLLRSKLVKEQAAALLKHPLAYELSTARLRSRVPQNRGVVANWRSGTVPPGVDDSQISAIDQSLQGLVMSHGGSSFGNVDALLPRQYSDASQNPALRLVSSQAILRCRPTELYLGASTINKRLRLHIFWDKNVYEESVIKEWFEEVIQATGYYLINRGTWNAVQSHL
ncbi:hypothetical protein BDQ17DRAFT_1341682 [Cyathus striatus]|nr:hypothetical protein BDQ17DRAFT_1341682 [Cyathus striatus]